MSLFFHRKPLQSSHLVAITGFGLNEYLSSVQYCPRNTLQLMFSWLFWEMPYHMRMMNTTMKHYLNTQTGK